MGKENIMQEEEKNEISEQTEPLFKTHCVWTKELLIALQKNATFKFRVFMCILAILLISAFIAMALLDGNWIFYGAMAAMMSFLAVYRFFFPYIVAGRQYRHYQGLYGAPAENEQLFFEDRIVVLSISTNGKVEIAYEKIYRLMKKKNLYILCMKDKTAFFFRKEDLIYGDVASLERFLIEKCPQAKRNF